MTRTGSSSAAHWARCFRLGLAAAGIAAVGCGNDGGSSEPAGTLAASQVDESDGVATDGIATNEVVPGEVGEGSAPVDGSAIRVTCDADDMMTELGWAKLPGPATVGAVYIATVSYEGDEPCIAARFDSVLLDAQPQTTPIPGPLPVAISRGMDIELGPTIDPVFEDSLRADILDPTELLLENASVTSIEPPAYGWLSASAYSGGDEAIGAQHQRLRDVLTQAEDAFVLIVTRAYSAERVTNLDGGVDGIPLPPHYPAWKVDYDCAALPLGEGKAFQIVDGVFVDQLAYDSYRFGTRADLPRQFCPQLPGVDVPPGNGVLRPAQ